MKKEDILNLFKENKLRATPQRIAVYEYLCEHRVHPDVDTIYNDVKKENPSFSKTTVYNALKSLSECNLIIPVMIDESKIRYDADTSFHGHFKCEKCKKIFDFSIENTAVKGLDGFEIKQKDVYFSGLCNHCKK